MTHNIDPRTHDLDDLKRLGAEDYWLLKADNLHADFLAHCEGVWRHGGEYGSDFRTEPGGIPVLQPNRSGNTGVRDYAHKVVADRLLAANTPDVIALAELIPTPEGWTRRVHDDPKVRLWEFGKTWERSKPGSMEILLISPDERTQFLLHLFPISELHHYEGDDADTVGVHVDVNFQSVRAGKESWFTYTRRGHDICAYYCGDLTDWSEAFSTWMDRVEATRARDESKISVPHMRWHVTPGQLEEIKDKLAAGKNHHFVPASMGTGNLISTRRHSWGRQAHPDTAAFFGVSELWIQDTDCD